MLNNPKKDVIATKSQFQWHSSSSSSSAAASYTTITSRSECLRNLRILTGRCHSTAQTARHCYCCRSTLAGRDIPDEVANIVHKLFEPQCQICGILHLSKQTNSLSDSEGELTEKVVEPTEEEGDGPDNCERLSMTERAT